MKRRFILIVMVAVSLGLAGCSIFKTPTPTPTSIPIPSATPTATPMPYWGPVTFAAGVTAAGGIINPATSFPPGIQSIYAVWPYRNMTEGLSYTLRWHWNGALWREDSFVWDSARDGAEGTAKWIPLSDPNGLIPGEYQLELYLGGQQIQVATFVIQEFLTPTPIPTATPTQTRTAQPTPTATSTPATEVLIRGARNALVKIWVPNDSGSTVAEGSGSIVDSRGLILTNWHVLADSSGAPYNTAGQAIIGLFRSPDAPAEKEYVAQVLTYSRDLDLAVLRIVRDVWGRGGPFASFPTVRLGSSDLVDAPDRIFILGYPALTYSYPTITEGIVSGRARNEYGEWITTDTEINPGNSGGMALDVQATLIGVPSRVTFDSQVPGKMGYIRPINLAKPLIEEARRKLTEPIPPTPSPGFPVGSMAAITAPDGLNIRSGPGLSYSVLWKAPYETRVTILAGPQYADAIPWYQVSVVETGLVGWCSGNYLRATAPGEPSGESLIAFASDRTGNYDVYVMQPDGTNVQNLTQHPAKDGDPSWSPDRRYLAFDSDRGGDADIYILDLGSGLTPPRVIPGIQGTGDQIHPVWAKDGQRLAYVSSEDGDWEIFISLFDGTSKRQLTHNAAWDSFPTWSPDGSEIIFTSARDGNYELYAIDVNTGAERRLTNNPESDAFPAYSPDGSRIVFVSARTGLLELYSANPRNVEGTLARLTDSSAVPQANRYPDWSPDGQWIVFTSWRDGQAEIYTIWASGLYLKRLTDSPSEDDQPAWNQ
jgi:Tol biopolymer transport system component/S1-C subfamily serine protease